MLVHEFVLVDTIPKEINYKDYNRDEMVVISDKFILDNHEPIRKVEMLDENLEVITGIDYHGTTVINYDAATKLKKELNESCKESEDLSKLLDILNRISIGKYIIHFGI